MTSKGGKGGGAALEGPPDVLVVPEAAGTVPTGGAQPLAGVKPPPLSAPEEPVHLFNRELSWLEFNRRVLAEAEDPSVPLMERLKFLSICSTNLDEFFMVRVAGIRQLVAAGLTERSPDGLTPKQQLKAIRERSKKLIAAMYECLGSSLLPSLAEHGIRIEEFSDLSRKEQAQLEEYFRRNLAPILTPLAIDPGHPFPFLANLALSLAVLLYSSKGEEHVVFMKVPPQIPRLIRIGDEGSRYVPVEALIGHHAASFFPGLRVKRVVPFRLIRNSEISIQEDEVEDLLKSIETELRRRERKEPVLVEVGADSDEFLVDILTSATDTAIEDVVFAPGLLKLGDLMQIYTDLKKSSLKDQPFNPRIPLQLANTDDIFSLIRQEDILLHRPYDSFAAVVELLQSAAEDPDVVAIKQTLYRVDADSPIVKALASAALSGKQVTVIVELQARFDEKKNIAWARQLESAGVQVVYGLVGIKTHCKICIVVRREGADLRRYVHLSTGNYNAGTARVYTDIDLFTTDEALGDDASQLMNLLTGFSLASVQDLFDGHPPELKWNRAVVAPMDYHSWVLAKIENEKENAAEGKPARILAKMNALVDPAIIQALYGASRAGVRIDMVIRGICCLVPGVEKLSENIHVVSVVDRFLEHPRLFLFENGGRPEVWASSGDWMPRNFFRRFELTFPLVDPRLVKRAEEEILAISLADNVKAWKLQPDGSYRRRTPGDHTPVRSQERFIEIARSEAVRFAPYEEMMVKPASFRRKGKKLRKKLKASKT